MLSRQRHAPWFSVFHSALRLRRGSHLNGKGSSSKPRPDKFGQFRVRADLGASRFGPVYLGREPSSSDRVVIRTFDLSEEWREFGELSDLLSSFRTLCETTLDHAGLARPLAFGAEGDIPFVVYSDLAGTAMEAVMRQDGPRPVAEVLQRARQLADAIDVAANAGVCHGMLAPCDVILDREGTGVAGFGLAQALIKVGFPAEAVSPYGSPQRLAGAPPTPADDIYSLAAITLELLIGTPADPDQEREAQGLPARRPVSRPAPHETRVFTTIAGVDAGKLRAAFAAAFSEEPSGRPATAAEFVASLQDAISSRHGTEEPAPSVVPSVSDEREDPPAAPVAEAKREEHKDPPSAPVVEVKRDERKDPPSAPVAEAKREERKDPPPAPVVEAKRDERKDPPSALVLETKRAEEEAVLALSSRQERVAAEGRETPAKSQPITPESHKHEPSDFKPEEPAIRLEPIVDDALIADVTPPRARSMDDASFGMSVQSGSGAFLVAAAVVISFAAGFGGGFVVGQFSRPSTEAGDVNHQEPVAAPQPTRAVVEDPKPIASTPPKTVAPISHQKAPSAAPITARPTSASAPPSIAAVVAPQRTMPAVVSGRLVVRSTPAGADVMIDGQPSGVTPLTLGELAFGAHTIAVSHPGHDSRRQRVTLSERRPARSVAFKLRPTSEPAQATAATNTPPRPTSEPAQATAATNTPLRPASEPAQATAATNTPLRPASEPTQATAATNTTGSLQVASRPSGAQVFVDDSLIGTTPFLLSNVETGSKRLRIELSGYKSWEKSVQIEPSARSRVSASLEP